MTKIVSASFSGEKTWESAGGRYVRLYAHPMAEPRPSWQLADLIDYEFFLDADERQATDLHARDRQIYREEIAPALSAATAGGPVGREERRAILRRWTDARRRQLKTAAADPDEMLFPGEAFAQVRGGVAATLAVVGLLIGWAAATAALSYSAGAEPINAFVFFVEFALAQVLILVGAFAVVAMRWWFPDVRIPSLARFCVRASMSLAGALWKRHRVRIAGARRQDAEALFGVLRARHTLYRGVLVWSLVGLTQIFAVAFNAGVLGSMTARHLFHDLDFGWESTWLDADEVARATRVIATPWSWLVRPGYPDAAQVAGSQNRKRDSGRLDAESLKSWSQFLFGVVIVYGLLPRLVLMALAARAGRSTLGRLAFNDGRSALTLNRLLTPIVQTHGEQVYADPAVRPADTSPPRQTSPAAQTSAASNDAPALVLNLTGYPFDEPAAAGAVGRGAAAAVFEANTADADEEKRAFAELAARAAAAPDAEVFALLASWVPPMIASRLSLDGLRASVGPGRLVTLVLVGKPAPDGAFKPVRPADRELWAKAVQTRGDAFLCLP